MSEQIRIWLDSVQTLAIITCLWGAILHELIIQILKKNQVALTWKLINWSGPNFADVMTAELSWHVQTWDLTDSVEP